MAKKKKIRRTNAGDLVRWKAEYEERKKRHEYDMKMKDQEIKRLEKKLTESENYLFRVLKDFHEEVTA